MSFLKSTLLATAAALISTSAYAADPVANPSTGFDWDGFYAGVGVTGTSFSNGGPAETVGFVDAIIGFNVTNDQILFGLEGWIGAYADSSSTGTGGGVEARVGYLANPDMLIYTGVGRYHFDAGGQYTTVGLGAEFVVGDNVTIDTEYKYWGWSNTGFTGHSIGASANWHFE
ncbi:outer membrane protein [Maritalea porphyrae]|uniref:Outer membrane protein beta-barrel domain-containing protein n=1 Tax=Maritalea porphyrae TaxID=880732 RepID=A0ABQ5UV24_9HYPH|nr:hypothetical protein [Maritalea porphyrae]GLQ18580.1 hypothetical protein GCM10007879_28290 [Maritalea porphyrae]